MAKPAHITNPSQSRKCGEVNCTGLVVARGLCRRHYTVWWEINRPTPKPCSKAGCNRPSRKAGMCQLHYTQEHRIKTPNRCSHAGCQRGVLARGLCNTHYKAYGVAKKLPPKDKSGVTEKFLRALVGHVGTECVIWPFSRTAKGYSWASVDGVQNHGHRWMCIMAHGEPPFLDAEVCHSCGNRSCVNPNHLRWDTRLANMADQYAHGTRVRGESICTAKLTEAQVLAIYADPRKKFTTIAKDYACGAQAVACIKSGKTWSWLTRHGRN
jgi:hypothetical protein